MALMVAPVTLTNPYAIYERARAFWDGATYAQGVSYGITVSVTRGAKVSAAHYHAWYDTRADRVVVNAASDEERAAPYVPHGVGTAFQLTWYKHRSKPLPVSEPDRTFDYLGVPMLAPNYAFGLRSVAPNVAGGSGGSNEATALKTIASVDVVKRQYAVALAGMAEVDGHADYDLRLEPVGDSDRYRLRELWIDASTFATDRLLEHGNFVADGLSRVPWVVTFAQIGGAPYIASEQAQNGFTLDGRHYDGASVDFTAIAEGSLPPQSEVFMFATGGGEPESLREP